MRIDTLQFKSLSFGYEPSRPLVENSDFDFPMDQHIWVGGASGSGKSVVLKLIAGLLNPTAGDLFINGKSVGDMSFNEFQPYRLRMGYVFDWGGLLTNRTLQENLLLPLLFHKMCPPSDAIDRVAKMLARFDLQADARQLPASVSFSKRKCVLIARAFLHRPELLLLDEPLTGLSLEQITFFEQMIAEHHEQYGLRHVFFTSQKSRLAKDLHAGQINLEQRKLHVVSGSFDAISASDQSEETA